MASMWLNLDSSVPDSFSPAWYSFLPPSLVSHTSHITPSHLTPSHLDVFIEGGAQLRERSCGQYVVEFGLVRARLLLPSLVQLLPSLLSHTSHITLSYITPSHLTPSHLNVFIKSGAQLRERSCGQYVVEFGLVRAPLLLPSLVQLLGLTRRLRHVRSGVLLAGSLREGVRDGDA